MPVSVNTPVTEEVFVTGVDISDPIKAINVQSADIDLSETVSLDSIPPLDLSSKDIITADDVGPNPCVNEIVASVKKKRSYKKKSSK